MHLFDFMYEGEYFYKIADFVMEDEVMTAKQFQIGSPMIHAAPLWEGDNVGDGAYLVYKQIDPAENKFKFRTIKQLTGGTGKPILMPFDGDQPDEIEFRTISERESDAQIHVEGDVGDSAIKIRGNDYDAMIDLPGGGTIQTKDGLVYSNTPGITGDNFNIKVQNRLIGRDELDEVTVEDDGEPFFIYFRGGIATLTDPGGDIIDEKLMTGTIYAEADS